MTGRGLDEDGTILREGALDRVPAAFVPVVDAARARITAAFGGPRLHSARLHSAYLYGSIPRGTAVPGVSDLDLLIVFRDEPAAADRAAADALEAALDDAYPQVTGVGIVLGSVRGTLSELDRSAELFAHYYPERAGQMRRAAAIARTPSADPAVLTTLIDDLGPWLAAEYTAVHGEKAPRP